MKIRLLNGEKFDWNFSREKKTKKRRKKTSRKKGETGSQNNWKNWSEKIHCLTSSAKKMSLNWEKKCHLDFFSIESFFLQRRNNERMPQLSEINAKIRSATTICWFNKNKNKKFFKVSMWESDGKTYSFTTTTSIKFFFNIGKFIVKRPLLLQAVDGIVLWWLSLDVAISKSELKKSSANLESRPTIWLKGFIFRMLKATKEPIRGLMHLKLTICCYGHM